jgi:hypothetical protein
MKVPLTILLLLTMTGCASTRVTGYTDPDYVGRGYSSAAVFANTSRMEHAAELEAVTCRVIVSYGVACQRISDLFPPTRTPSADDIRTTLAAKGVQVVLILTPQDDASESHVALYQSFTNAHAYSYSSSANGYGYGTTVPIRATRRAGRARAELIDYEARRTVWVGEANTEGKGRLGTSDSKFRGSLAKGTVATLVRAGHFVRKP